MPITSNKHSNRLKNKSTQMEKLFASQLVSYFMPYQIAMQAGSLQNHS